MLNCARRALVVARSLVCSRYTSDEWLSGNLSGKVAPVPVRTDPGRKRRIMTEIYLTLMVWNKRNSKITRVKSVDGLKSRREPHVVFSFSFYSIPFSKNINRQLQFPSIYFSFDTKSSRLNYVVPRLLLLIRVENTRINIMTHSIWKLVFIVLFFSSFSIHEIASAKSVQLFHSYFNCFNTVFVLYY